ncbi:MAG: hypothetical protein Q8Q92_00585 [bacterium]|nr:hypothetical protein [bacterium]
MRKKKQSKECLTEEVKKLDEAAERFAQIVVAHIDEKYKKKNSEGLSEVNVQIKSDKVITE